uniref:C3H1-type domain-containing protein n=1 Tax=Arundo donax TaxID=35708 RepID=A0A0A8YCC4_ARUDO
MCEYAHGVFESWLHPAQYRTRLCKDGVGCARRVCFFAHTPEELRPLYVSAAGSRGAMEMAAAMGMGLPSPGASFTPPLSPSGAGSGVAGAWPQAPSVPALCLPGSSGNFHLSRLRTSLSARSMAVDELLASADYDGLVGSPASVRSARGKTLVPSNLDDLFSAEMASAAASHSPRYADQGGASFSPTRKAAMLNQFQQQQSLLSPQATAAAVGPEPVSPMSSRLLAALAQREKMQQQTLRSMSSRDLGSGASLLVGSPVGSSWSKWGIPSGTPDWGANDEELGRLKRSSSFELRSGANGDEPDLSWVNTLVKEPTPEKPSINGTKAMESIGTLGEADHEGIGEDDTAGVIGGWLEQLQLDEMVV